MKIDNMKNKLNIYRAILNKKSKKAYIEDQEGIRYIQFLPHPDGDLWMTTEGIDIILDRLGIIPVNGSVWTETKNTWELGIDISQWGS